MIPSITILPGDCRETLKAVPESCVHCCVTSPPYWNLRDYGCDGQIGLEPSLDLFVQEMVNVFRLVHRALRQDGTLWLNLGDTRKQKELLGVPWRVALALQADGWFLRQDVIWHKPSPMPEAVRDRCTTAHEHLFLLSKSWNYYWNREAMLEPVSGGAHARGKGANPKSKVPSGWDTGAGNHRTKVGRYRAKQNESFSTAVPGLVTHRNRRSVWTVPSSPFKGAHFATFPPKLIEPCILASCPVGGIVLDPFGGSGTTGAVALQHGRHAILCELNPDYCRMIEHRTAITAGLPL